MNLNLSDSGEIQVLPDADGQGGVRLHTIDRDGDKTLISLTKTETEWLALAILTANGTVTT